MPDISLLQPTVLRGVVEKLTAPESLLLLSRAPRTPWPYPSATWDVLTGSRMVAKPNTPNSEAHIIPKLGRSAASAAFAYFREKKVFEPTTIHWLRQPGTLAARNAEAAVLREVQDLAQRFDNAAESLLWGMFSGSIDLVYPEETGGATVTVDYQMPASHKVTAGTGWDSATPTEIVADIVAWKRLVARDGKVALNEAYCTEVTIQHIFTSFATNNATANLLSDRMKDQYYGSGTLPGFMGINWHVAESTYQDDAGATQLFSPDNQLILGNFNEGRPFELYEGPSADDDAPSNFVGRFAKTWKEKDPSARQVLLEWHFLPVLTRPEQFIYCADVTA